MSTSPMRIGWISLLVVFTATACMASTLLFEERFPTNEISPTINYTDGTTIGGSNGWTVSGVAIATSATNHTVGGGLSASIDAGSAITNTFSNGSTTNKWWTDMYVKIANWEDGAAVPDAPTNGFSSAFFMTNGYPVIFNGTSGQWVTNRLNAAGGTLDPYNTNTWAHVSVFSDYSNKTWALFIDGVLIAQQIGFADTNVTVCSNLVVRGGDTKLDDILVADSVPSGLTTDLNTNSIPDGLEIQLFGHLTGCGLVFTNTPFNAVAWGSALSPDPIVAITNALGGLASQLWAQITIETNYTSVGGGSLTGSLKDRDCSTGTVEFTGLYISEPGTYTLFASAPGLVSATSTTFTVTKQTPTVTNWGSASEITYGQALSASTLSGVAATNIAGVNVPGANSFDSPGTTPIAGAVNHNVTFTPNDAVRYSNVAGSVSVTVGKQTPTVVWSASGITYGQAFSSSTLNGAATNIFTSAPVPGANVFEQPAVQPVAGTTNPTVIFTPGDLGNFNAVTGTAQVVVSKTVPSVVWSATAITYGQAFSNSTLSGAATNTYNNATVLGSSTFNAPPTQPNAGIASAAVTFTPVDTDNYDIAPGSVSVTVNKAAQTNLTWNPVPTSPQLRDTTQTLNATGGTTSSNVIYSIVGPAGELTGASLKVIANSGTILVTATKPGGSDYEDAVTNATVQAQGNGAVFKFK